MLKKIRKKIIRKNTQLLSRALAKVLRGTIGRFAIFARAIAID